MAAIDALKATHQIEILITVFYKFRLGRLHGFALARISRVKRLWLKVRRSSAP